jgi:hypothetical protein
MIDTTTGFCTSDPLTFTALPEPCVLVVAKMYEI